MRIPGPDRAALHVRAEVLARRVDRILYRILTDAAAGIGASVVRAAAPPPAPYGPASADDLNGIVAAWLAALGPIPAQRTTATAGGIMGWLQAEYATAAAEQLQVTFTALGYDLGSIPSITVLSEAEAARTYLAAARNRLVGVGDTLWHDARRELVEGLSQGEAIPTLAKRITGMHEVSAKRATVIARTEVISSSNAGSIVAMRSTGLVATKEFLATLDSRTRPSHAEANGQIVGIDEAFDVGGASLDFPGDPSGPPEETIMCRCSLAWGLVDPV